MRIVLTLLLLLASLSAPARADEPSAAAVFEKLKTLQGHWRSSKPDSKTTVEYRLIANGSVLVETWTMSPTRQSMTVYSLDGERLLATHYCPQGNAPRLVLAGTDESGTHRFDFLDGSNLQNPEGFHEHAFTVRIDSPDALTRRETYIGNRATYDAARDRGDEESFARILPAAPESRP
ncbi:hypothetical protein [Arenimonas sp.]|uniref:hypothetical protein n=1 Tax=Arenimonas sp. TaxID=1872635 RepID=UPI0039E49F0B